MVDILDFVNYVLHIRYIEYFNWFCNSLQPRLKYEWCSEIFILLFSGHYSYRRVAELHMRLTFWENLAHRHKGWNRSQIKTKCLYFNFDLVVRSKIGSVISKKGEITLSLQKRELWSTNFESIFCSVKTLFFRKLFYFLKSILLLLVFKSNLAHFLHLQI